MTARRQSSTTSLAKFARASSPDLNNPSFDFCNSFWGPSDVGYEVLFTRMRGGARAMDELRAFWKERASIEEDYAKRMSKLAKQTLGKDEIGELRNALDTLRLETDKQASAHLQLAQQVRNELEAPSAAFITRQSHFKKTYQSAIEKAFKTKQTQESYVNRAREKYETDCLRINAYSAQANLMQGKELEKLTLKLERAKQTVSANEADFSNFSRQLADTVVKWEKDWKGFCDGCQDLEEERIEFMKDNVWAYANAVSTVCVSDDESCEHIRVSLEQLEPERDMENFVRDYGTGNQIPEPPQFTGSMSQQGHGQKSAPTMRYAHFPRSSQRTPSMQQLLQQRGPVQEDEPINAGEAGVGAGGRGRVDGPGSAVGEPDAMNRSGAQSRAQSRASSRGPGAPALVNGNHAPSSSISAPAFKPSSDPHAEPIDSTHQLRVGENAYNVDPDKDPQNASTLRSGFGAGPTNGNNVGASDDPLYQMMSDLKASGTVRRRESTNAGVVDGSGASKAPGGSGSRAVSPQGANGLSAPESVHSPPNRDYRNSAEVVVGGFPGTGASRSTSPAAAGTSSPPAGPMPPTASFMRPPQSRPTSTVPVEEIVGAYGQSFPNERRASGSFSRSGPGALSRSNSRAESRNGAGHAPSQSVSSSHIGAQSIGDRTSYAERLGRPVSREGYPGIGAGSRSPSPQPPAINHNVLANLQAPTSGPSPAPGRAPSVGHNYSASITSNGSIGGRPGATSISPIPGPGGQGSVMRPTSPGGIVLDPSGRVTRDDLADRHAQQQAQQRQSPYQQQQQQEQPPRSGYGAPPGPPYNGQSTSPVYPGQTNQSVYIPPPPPPIQQPPPSNTYNQPPAAHYAPQHPHHQLPPPAHNTYQPQPPVQQQQYGGGGYAPPHRGSSVGYYDQPIQQHPSHQPHPGHQHQQQPSYSRGTQDIGYAPNGYGGGPGFRSPSPGIPPPSQQERAPAPTGQYVDGRPVLFYVKALYDYQATIEEEFDFQTGDIIAVTSTPEDGWWTGVLLDDSRRIPGRIVFPSNFVCLF